MIKEKLKNKTTKELLLAKQNDKLHTFLLADNQFRGAIVNCTLMVNEMRQNHQLGILETLILGHAYIAATLMTTTLKGNSRLMIKVECEGPIKGLSVEANSSGEVRGFIKNKSISIDKPIENSDLAPFFGTGYLTVTNMPENAKQPYSGNIKLEYGNLAMDLANYYLTSEQTPTSFNLSIHFDSNGEVIGAGGLLIQTMPDTTPDMIEKMEDTVRSLPSIGKFFSENGTPIEFLNGFFHDLSPYFLAKRRVEFFCRCRKEHVGRIFVTLPKDTVDDILTNDTFPLNIKCENCNTDYQFEKEEIIKIVEQAQRSE